MALFSESELRKSADKLLRDTNESIDVAILKHVLASVSEDEFDIFLSHSYTDRKIILGLRKELEDMGYSAYVDWLNDKDLNRAETTKKTADRLRERMKKCKSLLFATSLNSSYSKWMPWECGYFDGIDGKVAICPIAKEPILGDTYEGQEYLGLYPYITTLFTSGKVSLWVHESSKKYVRFADWLKGEMPTEH